MLKVRQLSICFSSYAAGLRRHEVTAIRSLDLTVDSGQILAVVGQSGAGKSLLAHALLGILPSNASMRGELLYKDALLTRQRMTQLRGKEIALVPQSVTHLNPLLYVGVQVARAAELGGVQKRHSLKATLEAFGRYDLQQEVARLYPHELSGGMARRVMTASATIGGANLIVADEPTNGLDPSRTAEALAHLRQLADTGKAVVLITHDIESALTVADTVSIFCGGVTVEEAQVSDFSHEGALRHPYSQALWNSLPANGFSLPQNTAVPLSKADQTIGCPYSSRCCNAGELCTAALPEMRTMQNGKVRCHNA
ncbi:ATP-binding cassette domain-containing protein [Oleidesulfovibrio sp.]|uniref:ATP-binding cassette domain-containing protein n=1 Tax=Oleidesulfovibrio sp. TaxID=2909707 RepID=UPI003A855128